jgi:hypothetical protein
MSPGTAANYRRCIDLKFKPALGALAVSRLDTATLDRFYAERRRRGAGGVYTVNKFRVVTLPYR